MIELTAEPTQTVGDRVPRRGNGLSRAIGKAVMRSCGWKIEGEFPNVPKCVIVAAPHTSNWDFFYGICAAFAIGLRLDWIGKHTLFRWPFGRFMRLLGGTPVNREETHGVVEQIVETMNARDGFSLCLAPEGTRKRVGRWKTGFYHVAIKARVPILLAYIDYERKVIGFSPTIEPTGDIEREMAEIQGFYRDRVPRYPAQF